ncbi:MAG: hypothetical protein ACM3PC_13335, partial [Deltaproteobacteria bacterium]
LPALDRGAAAQGGVEPPPPPFPALGGIELPHGQPAVRLGETLALDGVHLGGPSPTAIFSHPLLPQPLRIAAAVNADGSRAEVTLPNAPADQAKWPAGAYALTLAPDAARTLTTSAITLALAPRITAITPAIVVGGKAKLDAQGALTLTVKFSPQVWKEQRLTLLFGSQAVDAGPRSGKVDQFTFKVPAAPLGKQFVRLRVEGVDSLVIDYTAATPALDATQAVEVVP